MIVNLTAAEAFQIYELLSRRPDLESASLKIKQVLLDTLDQVQEKRDMQNYESWSQRESKKIENLKKANLDILKNGLASKTQKNCSISCTRCSSQREEKID